MATIFIFKNGKIKKKKFNDYNAAYIEAMNIICNELPEFHIGRNLKTVYNSITNNIHFEFGQKEFKHKDLQIKIEV